MPKGVTLQRALVVWCAGSLIGCGAPVVPSGSGDGNDNPDVDQSPEPNGSLSLDEAATVLSVDGAQAIARAVAAISPVKDLQAIFEGGSIPPACPQLDADVDGGDIVLVYDYGAGCTPMLFNPAVISGSVAGTVFAAFNAFELTVEAVGIDGDLHDGTASGSFELALNATTFFVSFDLVLGTGTSVRSNGTVELDAAGTINIREGTFTLVGDDGEAYLADFTDVGIDHADSPLFIPGDGTALFRAADSDPDGESLLVRFTSQTQLTGEVDIESSP